MSLHGRILNKLRRILDGWKKRRALSRLPKNNGYCVICESESVFIIHNEWLRANYKCSKCQSIPRNRALVNAVNLYCPSWPDADLHESSPSGTVSDLLSRKCVKYTSSHYYSDIPRGEYKGKHRSEDLSRLTFPDNSFDLIITSDVFEHVMEPEKAFAEIARVLRPGGMHIFTMPWYPHLKTSQQRARIDKNGEIEYLLEPAYHGNPIGGKGSLVTYDWGLDFMDRIYLSSGMTTSIHIEIDRGKGLDGKFLEVFVSRKAAEE